MRSMCIGLYYSRYVMLEVTQYIKKLVQNTDDDIQSRGLESPLLFF